MVRKGIKYEVKCEFIRILMVHTFMTYLALNPIVLEKIYPFINYRITDTETPKPVQLKRWLITNNVPNIPNQYESFTC